MKKKLRGLLSLWLAVMMVLTAMPMAFAEGEETETTPTTAKVSLYTGSEAIVKDTPPTDTEAVELTADDGKFSFNVGDVFDIIFPQTDKLLDGWNLWSTAESGIATTYSKHAWDATVTAGDLKIDESGYYKVLEPVWSLCEITEQPTAGNPTVEVTNSTLASYKWYNATVSESDVTLGDAVEGQTTDTLTVTPEADKSYVCEVKWTGKAGDEVTLTSDAVTFEEVTITFDANGGKGEMEDVTIITGEKYELPECEFEAPEGKVFNGWKVKETRVETPVITPDGSTFATEQEISISCATDGATIYYTTDGSTPTKESTEYTAPFSVNEDTTVEAIAYKDGLRESYTESAKFEKENVKKPSIALLREASQNKISITCETEGATIYYTTDGTTPTAESAEYTSPFSVDAGTTIKAIAVKENMDDSFISTATFNGGALEVPTLGLVGGGYSGGGYGGVSTVAPSISTSTIREPGDEITVTESITVSAVWAEKVSTPAISPSSKTIYNTTSISITCATEDADIYYTIDGSTPTTADTKYTKAFTVRRNPSVVKAIAVKEGMADSEVATKQYAVMPMLSGNSSLGGGGSYGGGGSSSYTVKFDTNGGLTIANQYVKKNGYVEEPKNPTKYGYEFIGWYTDKELTEEYDFDTKITESFTLYAKWEGEGSAPAETDLFDDVSTDDWFYDNVVYVTENGLMNGMDSNNFGPAIPLNRAMLVTILYRADGSPETSAVTPFADLKYNAYYENAVKWAYSNNIVNGMSDTEFGPEVLITREQLATILYRYADYKGYLDDTAASIGIIAPDAEFISDWALEAMAYCVENKIITGYEDGTIKPKGNTTRAEAATMLQRFIEAN